MNIVSMIGRVYKITNEDESIVYIGSSTKSLAERWEKHMISYKRWRENKDDCHATIYHHFKEHGVEAFSINLISEHEINDQRHLHEFEQLVIDQTSCVNKNAAYRSEEQKIQYQRKYREEHKTVLKKYIRDYYQANKLNQIANQSERIICECGTNIARGKRSRHSRSQKHQRLMEQQQA